MGYTTESKDLQETYIAQDQFKQSEYGKNIATRTLPEDYEEPQKPLKPPVVENKTGHIGTAHWRSEYSSTFSKESIAVAVQHRQVGPPFESVNPPSVVSAPN